MMRRPAAVVAAVAVAAGVLVAGIAVAQPEDAVSRGRSIFMLGRKADGEPLTAEVAGGVELPAGQYACVRCHRADGRGGLEGGVEIPNIRWQRLSGPVASAANRKARPAYSPQSLAKAIVFGVDCAGRALDALMPRYDLDGGDLSDLIAYLHVVGSEAAPGTSSSSVRVGVLLPLSGRLATAGTDTLRVLQSYFDDVNGGGGIYGRHLDLIGRDVGGGATAALEAVRALSRGPDEVFCFLGNAGAGAGGDVLAVASAEKIPVIGPLSFTAASGADHYIFRVLPTLFDQGVAAARYLSDAYSWNSPVAVLRPPGAHADSMLEGFVSEAARLELLVEEVGFSGADIAAIIARLKDASVQGVVVFAGADAVDALVEEAERQAWHPRLVVSSVLLERALAASAPAAIRVAPPLGLMPQSNNAHGLLSHFQRIRRIAEEQRPGEALASANTAMTMAAFASAEVLSEGLKRSGRELTREGLVAALAGMSGFETGVLPAISFGPRRRRGVRGAALVVVPAHGGGSTKPVWVDVSDIGDKYN